MVSTHTVFNLLASDNLAIKDDSNIWITYGELVERIEALRKHLVSKTKKLIFLYANNSISSVVAYIAAVQESHVVAFLDPNLPEHTKQVLFDRYHPDFTLRPLIDAEKPGGPLSGYELLCHDFLNSSAIYNDTAVLLSTSGSTGTPKFVRLTRQNIQSNAESIVSALNITKTDRALAHLPIHYSYGLSIISSHLQAGAALSMTNHTFMQRPFWPRIQSDMITNLAGVPWHYETMSRMGPQRLGLSKLKHMTQAGGRLAQPIQEIFQNFMESAGGAFHVMYGQTEAAPRITTRSHQAGQNSLTSVGAVLDGGKIDILDGEDKPVKIGVIGQVVYTGPNVMLGYANARDDLSRGDETQSILYTGDLGFLDQDGELTITGRSDRMIKVAGLRVNLDDIEKTLEADFQTLIVYSGTHVHVHILSQGDESERKQSILKLLADRFSIPATAYKIIILDEFPVTSRGKLDYKAAMRSLTQTSQSS